MKKINSLLLALLAAMVMLLSSCSKDTGSLSMIPADTNFVASVNVEKFAKELNADKGSLDSSQLGRVFGKNAADMFSKLSDALELENVMVYALPGADFFNFKGIFFAPVTDFAKLKAIFDELNAPASKQGNFSVFEYQGEFYLSDEAFLWAVMPAASAQEAVSKVESSLKEAQKASLADVDCVTRLFKNDNLVSLAYSAPLAPADENHGGKALSLISFNVKDNALVIDTETQFPDGEPAPMKGLSKISTDVLQYVPSNAFFAMAIGLSDNFDWNGLVSGSLNQMPSMQLGQISMVVEYLKKIDGTLMMSIGADPGIWDNELSGSIPSLKYILMAHASQQNVNSFIADVTAMAQGFNIPVTDAGNGLKAVNLGSSLVYFGSLDGYFTIASFIPSDNNGNSALTGKFEGKDIAMNLQVPSLKQVFSDCNFGLDIQAEAVGSKGSVVVKLPGSNEPILAALLQKSFF